MARPGRQLTAGQQREPVFRIDRHDAAAGYEAVYIHPQRGQSVHHPCATCAGNDPPSGKTRYLLADIIRRTRETPYLCELVVSSFWQVFITLLPGRCYPVEYPFHQISHLSAHHHNNNNNSLTNPRPPSPPTSSDRPQQQAIPPNRLHVQARHQPAQHRTVPPRPSVTAPCPSHLPDRRAPATAPERQAPTAMPSLPRIRAQPRRQRRWSTSQSTWTSSCAPSRATRSRRESRSPSRAGSA